MAEPKQPAGLEAVQNILSDAGHTDTIPAVAPPPEDPPEDPPAAVGSEEAPAGNPLAEVDTSDLGGIEVPALDPDAKPTTLDQAAEKLGLTTKQLYELEVPLRDGAAPLTLGAMKDHIQESEDLVSLRSELDERKSTFENDMMRARQELTSVVSLLPNVPPELIAQAQQAHLAHQERERLSLLSIKPEWRDPAVFASAKDAMVEVCAPYGFTRSDLDLVIDHRLTKLLHDYSLLKARVDSASASFKAVQTQQSRGGQKQSASQKLAATQAASKAAAQDGTPLQKTQAVDAILRQQ